MPRPALEVADIFRDHGAAWRKANAGHVSLEQLKVMSAIESCRTAALGGHVALCEKCAHIHVAYNSCLMGKFRNGELATSFIELSVNFRDFALHYESPPSNLLSVPWIKGFFAQTRWSFAHASSRFSSTTMAHGDSTAARSLGSNPRRRLQNVLSRQLHDLALRGSRRSTVVMESRALVDRDGVTENTVSLATESMVDSPLRNLPIRQEL
jgi:Transposase zinc-binding domain